MELCELAERILFASTLEEKLECPALITDERPGLPVEAPDTPGRPQELQFKAAKAAKAEVPRVHQLSQTRERGRLLHFFANHELLATELMALVLLRFPHAPAAFRRGVLQTLKDEQEHTALYLRRMRECGVQFGELPVSGYFWRAISRLETPLDYVAGLSLTFEQANLDFARYFGQGFAAAGDAETARLLERIYHDEIGHVAYGLKWFRRWKNPQESDWEAFCHQLKFPLSPQRAKGFVLNLEGRRAAGLDAEFIDQLNVYSQSKGRTPNVFLFNPLSEGRLARGKSFSPPKHQAMLGRDLETLPQFLGRNGDIVLVERRPSVRFLSAVKQAGFPLPQFVEFAELAAGALGGRKLAGLRPWAWGPDSLELLAPLFEQVTPERPLPERFFNENLGRLYSKSWSAEWLRRFLGERAPEPWLCTPAEAGVTVESVPEALAAIQAIRRTGHHKVVAKEALGLAGQNALRLWESALLDAQLRWFENVLGAGRQLVIEPWLEREVDFSVQMEMTRDHLKVVGYTGLLNDRKGQYQANWAAPNYERRLPVQVTNLFRGPADIAERFQLLFADLLQGLEAEFQRAGYFGPAGLDAFVYRDDHGAVRLKPLVEINPRYTMGRVTLELMKQAAPGRHGVLRLVSPAMAIIQGAPDFPAYARTLGESFPLRLEGEPVPRLAEGALCLNDPEQAAVCLAVFQVGRELAALLDPHLQL